MPTRRDFLRGASAACLATPGTRLLRLSIQGSRRPAPARLAVITDLHHGLAPDALSRFQAFVGALKARPRPDAVLQMGDFNYSDAGAAECLELWHALPHRKLNVLGNHDMDKCDKATALRALRKTDRYYTELIGGYRFVVLDLNHFRKDGALVAYANGNYFTDNATYNWADPAQLAWLDHQLRSSREPVILVAHQPLGFAEPGQAMPPEQVEVMGVVTAAARANPAGAVAAVLFGHLHVDRLEHVEGIPCLCVNSASYFWSQGMYPYTNPLFAFMEFTADGTLRIEGATGEFIKAPPAASDAVIGRSASISSRTIPCATRTRTG